MNNSRKPKSRSEAAAIIQRAFRNRKAKKVPSQSSKAAPVTVTYTRSRLMNTSSYAVHGEEFLGNVEYFAPNTYYDAEAIGGARVLSFTNPVYWTESRAQKAIKNYEHWRLRSVSYEFVPNVGTGWAGTVHMGLVSPSNMFHADSTIPALANLLSVLPSYKTIPLQSVGLSKAERSLHTSGVTCSRLDPDPDQPFFLLVGTGILTPDGSAPADKTAVGGIYVTYDLVCDGPCPPWDMESDARFYYVCKDNTGNRFVSDTHGLSSVGDFQASMTPAYGRVSIGSNAATVAGKNPTWTTATTINPGSTDLGEPYDSSGVNAYLGQKYSVMQLRQASFEMTLSAVTHDYYTTDLRIAELRSGIDVTSQLSSAQWAYATRVGVGIWGIFRLAQFKIFNTMSILGSAGSLTVGASRSGPESAEETPVLTTTTTTATAVEQPLPAATRYGVPLPPLRKN